MCFRLKIFTVVNLNRTLGAVFIGEVFAAILFGITSLQTFIFFKGNMRDNPAFKSLIAFLWFLDCLHLIFMVHGIYQYLIANFSNVAALSEPTWSLLASIVKLLETQFLFRRLSGPSFFDSELRRCVLARSNHISVVLCSVFARRIWLLSGRKNLLLFVILSFSLFVFATGIAFAARGFVDGSYARLILESKWLLYTALGGSVIADGLVTTSLCILLDRSRSGHKSTDSLVNALILYTINTGLLTSLCATACFVTFAIWPHEFVFMGIYFALSKLYLNSLLAMLNTREILRRKHSGIVTIPLSPSSIESPRMRFIATNASTAPAETTSTLEHGCPSNESQLVMDSPPVVVGNSRFFAQSY
ncbi:unnamed protein product [Cyclocybe aegerita]|uniref:DUF6534 domain-containing protein n=1 Tax=Cyclocybe aegerita TaxID=1973307 RepID=A0A8S0VYW4_CYCAE|nr:unnamed protein product [Cyclocybe aegerita]